MSLTNLKTFSLSWFLLKWNHLTRCHLSGVILGPLQLFCLTLSTSLLCISKTTSLGSQTHLIPLNFLFSTTQELFFICQNPVQVIMFFCEAFLGPSSPPWQFITLSPDLFCVLNTVWQLYQICCNFLFVHLWLSLESSVFTCAIVFSKY